MASHRYWNDHDRKLQIKSSNQRYVFQLFFTIEGVPVALVSGGASGIGDCCARAFLRAGWKVATVDLQPIAAASNGSHFHLTGDITREELRQQAVAQTLERFGGIHAVVHCAGIGLYRTVRETKPEHFEKVIQTNAVAPWRLSQIAMEHLRQSSGAIVSLGSVAGDVALPWAAAYSVSKAALHSMMDAMRRDCSAAGIRVIDIRAGIVKTNFRRNVIEGAPPPKVERLRLAIPPERVAEAAIRALESRKSGVIYIPRIGRLFALAGTLSPWLMDIYLKSLRQSDGLDGN
jgi:NAD(P)-dependent dehydrogenase (short-subunit alcohol dehydrogenase family)